MDRNMCFSIVLVLGAVVLLTAGSVQASIITVSNSDFETPVVPSDSGYHYNPSGGWVGQRSMVMNPPEYNAAYGDTVPAAKEGNQIGVLNGNTDYTWMTQDLTDTYQAGQDYTLQVSMASASNPMLEPSNLTVMLGYWSGNDPIFIGRSFSYPTAVAQRIVKWNEVSHTSWADFTVNTGVIAADNPAVGKPITVWFGDEDTGWPSQYWLSGIWCVDDCHLSSVPEPNMIALALSGVFALAASAWRKRK
jgi:hypothetical protein